MIGSDGLTDRGGRDAGRPDPPGVADPAEARGSIVPVARGDGATDLPQAATPTTQAIARPAIR